MWRTDGHLRWVGARDACASKKLKRPVQPTPADGETKNNKIMKKKIQTYENRKEEKIKEKIKAASLADSCRWWDKAIYILICWVNI